MDATTITCLTGVPGSPKPQGPQPVTVTFPSIGAAALVAPSSAVLAAAGPGAGPAPLGYQYVDLWSRKSTWGGQDPPVEGDSVVVPPGEALVALVPGAAGALTIVL